ncbi:MAG: PIN domain-containing protein [Hyphomicrobiales bacterium]|jgi:predicted nucleic acid-binding protein|nr:PIN domain-containing protein [Hyphomicrobiales bacterium]
MRAFYLDACVIIDLREKANGAGGLGRTPGLLRELVGWATRGWCRVMTSELSMAECLVEPLRAGANLRSDNEEARIRADWYRETIAMGGAISAIPVSRDVLARAGELRARHRSIKFADAIHLASAEFAGAEALITRDSRLSRWLEPDRTPVLKGVSLVPASEDWLAHTLSELRPA